MNARPASALVRVSQSSPEDLCLSLEAMWTDCTNEILSWMKSVGGLNEPLFTPVVQIWDKIDTDAPNRDHLCARKRLVLWGSLKRHCLAWSMLQEASIVLCLPVKKVEALGKVTYPRLMGDWVSVDGPSHHVTPLDDTSCCFLGLVFCQNSVSQRSEWLSKWRKHRGEV